MGNCCANEQGNVSQPSKSDDKFEKAVNAIFDKYDKDKSGFLDKAEVVQVINAALAQMEGGRKASAAEVEDLVRKSDTNQDQKISREELLVLFKKVAKK